MPLLGVLTCEIFELEIAHLVKNDPLISRVFVINQKSSLLFIKALGENALPDVIVIDSLDEFLPSPGPDLTLLVHVLEIGLHSSKSKLQQALVTESLKLGSCVEALFLGYGLCGNALDDPELLLSHLKIPFFLPWDKNHPADDCVGVFIGGREVYYKEQLKEAGTFFMTPGWTTHWQAIFEKDFGKVTIEMAQRLFKDYKRTLLISTPVMAEDQMRENIQEFNLLFNCTSESSKGSMEMLTRAWEAARTYLIPPTDVNAPAGLLTRCQDRVKLFEKNEGRRPRIFLGNIDPSGNGNTLKIVASVYSDLGFDVDIAPSFLPPEAVARMAVENDVHALCFSGSLEHKSRFEADLAKALAQEGVIEIPVIYIPFLPGIKHRGHRGIPLEVIAGTLDTIGA